MKQESEFYGYAYFRVDYSIGEWRGWGIYPGSCERDAINTAKHRLLVAASANIADPVASLATDDDMAENGMTPEFYRDRQAAYSALTA